MADGGSLGEGLDPHRIPHHVALIMDGNGRWAAQRGLDRTFGHTQGETALFDVIEGALELGIGWLTAYTFSTENWTRSQQEVDFLMRFNVDVLEARRDQMHERNVRMRFIGELDDERVPDDVRDRMRVAAELTKSNTRMDLVFAFNYGGRVELGRAARQLARDIAAGQVDPESVGSADLAGRLYIPEMPDPDLVIRSSGEYRTSNFLPWQSAYSEYVFSPVLWPDFDRHVLRDCIAEYQGRERRFGGLNV